MTESPVASKRFYLNRVLLRDFDVSQNDFRKVRYSTASLFFARGPVGWAVHAVHTIEAGDYIGDYLGVMYDFNLPITHGNQYSLSGYDDSTLVGGIISRVNTSSTPEGANARLVDVSRNGIPGFGLEAVRRILPGEEILWFYANPAYSKNNLPGNPMKLEGRPPLKLNTTNAQGLEPI